jgi:Fur family zinc uptake transcriptional regulator
MTEKSFSHHDHAGCVSNAMEAAETHCATQKLQFTPVRKRALEILLDEHKALGAYDLLARLRDDGLGSAPPVAYRALDFLVAHGFAHKIEKLNAYVACSHPGEAHDPAFMICRSCDTVAEAATDPQAGHLGRAADAAGFKIERTVIEAEGICPSCKTP